MKMYHNPRCRKSRETLAILQENKQEPELILYLEDVPTENELKAVIKKLGISPKDLVRRGEKIFKEEFKGKELNDGQWIKAMVKYPKLIERPIVIQGHKAVLGRPPENVLTLL